MRWVTVAQQLLAVEMSVYNFPLLRSHMNWYYCALSWACRDGNSSHALAVCRSLVQHLEVDRTWQYSNSGRRE